MSRSYSFQITSEEAGQRLDEFLASRFGGISRMRIATLLATGACRVNAGRGLAGYRLAAGDPVEFTIDESVSSAMRPEPVPLEIIHEDDHILVLVKPSGMLVHPTRSVKSGTLANALTYHLNRDFYADLDSSTDRLGPGVAAEDEALSLIRPGLVHRLDRATSGLMVIAATPRSLAVLSRHFHRRLVEKRYVALVRGRVLESTGAIQAPIGRDPDHRPQWGVMESGKPSETRFRVLDRSPISTLVELEPVTGRTNQLRIHLAHAGHPIIGDELYGQESEPHRRLCLHAWRLAFHHPAGGEWMEFNSPLPRDMAETLEEVMGARPSGA